MAFITRCPHCETSFNITESQLQKAHGIVRCGFCLQTFSALENQLYLDEEIDLGIIDVDDGGAGSDDAFDDTELPASEEYEDLLPEEFQDSAELQNLQIPTLEAANDALDEVDEVNLEVEAADPEKFQTYEEASMDRDASLDKDTCETEEEGAEIFAQEESLTSTVSKEVDALEKIEMLAEVDESFHHAAFQHQSEENWDNESSADMDANEEEDAGAFLRDEFQANEPASRESEVAEDMALASSDAESIAQPDPISPAEDANDEIENEFDLGLPESDSEEEYTLESAEFSADPAVASAAHSIGSKTSENSRASSVAARAAAKPELQILSSLYDDSSLERLDESNFDSLSDEPIAIHQQAGSSRLLKNLLLSLNVILLLGLAGQAVWKNIDSLLLDARFAPFSNVLCQVLSCPAVAQFNLNQFSTEELFVNAHPQRENALQIDFIFRNNATYPQAFPLVELNFTDLNRRLLANRLFSPDEYLDPELQQFELLPAGASVQIQLEIVDPGPEAINYSLALRHPGAP